MCTKPITMFNKAAGREVTIACRNCDACVATRRQGWVARAMAEKAMHPQTLLVALTYNDETQFNRDGARFFRYDDVRLFLARVRDAIKQSTGQVAALRFICAGEQGTKNGRVHWHIVLFSDVDLLKIGTFSALWGPVTEYSDIVAPPNTDMPRLWSMWPHGFVQVQEPDAGGMHYAMSYALKDQFSSAKSKDTDRISKSEEFATGLFRPSRNPPIGASWVDEQIYDMYEKGYVLPKLRLYVPNLRNYWVPSGPLRKRLLEGIRRVNNSFKAQHGRNSPQWRPLIIECNDNKGDLEALGVIQEDEDEETIETKISRSAREAKQRNTTKNIVTRCGKVLPCIECLRGLPDEILAKEIGVYFEGETVRQVATGAEANLASRPLGRINPWCQLKETASRKKVFTQSAREK